MSYFATKDVDFTRFIVLWNQKMGFTTPAIHRQMADWMECNWRKKNRQLLLMAFRASGKSTMVGLFAAWLLYRNPDLRILVLAADSVLARKMVRQVKKIIELHWLTSHLKPDKPDQWAGSRFTVKRMTQLRDPSMMARGITSNITGSRADIILCDDVEVPNTCDTAEKRGDLRERLSEIDYVLSPEGTQLYIGTPHTYYSIYADTPRKEIGEDQEFLKGFERLGIPVLDKDGKSAWPEKFSPAVLERMKNQTGPNKFSSQMMLKPVNITEGRLDPSLLRVYSDELDYSRELQTLFIGPTKLIASSNWWDPSFGSARGDRSVVAITYTDAEGNIYLHRVVYLETSGRGQTDEATWQCRQVTKIAKDSYIPSLSVETNGIGKFLPTILRNEIAHARVPCKVLDVNTTRPKDIRILEAFDAVLAAKRLFVHESVLQTPFMMEIQEWRPGIFRGHDDGLDAVAGAIAQQPIRLPRFYGSGHHNWMKHSGLKKAKTDFDI